MYSEELERFIEIILADNQITEKERKVLHNKAAQEGIDPDEIDVYIDGLLALRQSKTTAMPPEVPQKETENKMNYGRVQKCPHCGSVVEAASVQCGECGYFFRDINVVSSRMKLSEQLREIENKSFKSGGLLEILGAADLFEDENRDNARARTIANFPIPNGKEDLLEFMLFLEPYTKKSSFWSSAGERETIKAYKTKYEECKNKARLFYSGDPHFQSILGLKKGK